jgi:alkylhydroperoxidase/carboxymuconolactone decarboxylase family protein YurZ
MIALLASPIARGLAGLAFALAILASIYAKGRMDGRSSAKVEQMKATVEAFQKRQGIDDETRNLDNVALCIRLGGVRSDCEQLRGMAKAAGAAKPGVAGAE